MSAHAVAVLAELVALEELRCRMQALPPGAQRSQLRDEHARRQPMAWARAHAALAQAMPRLSAAAVHELDELRAVQRSRAWR